MSKPLAWFSIVFSVVTAVVFAQPAQPLPAAPPNRHEGIGATQGRSSTRRARRSITALEAYLDKHSKANEP